MFKLHDKVRSAQSKRPVCLDKNDRTTVFSDALEMDVWSSGHYWFDQPSSIIFMYYFISDHTLYKKRHTTLHLNVSDLPTLIGEV